MNLAVHKIAPAIACGCPIILKPASSTPLSCLELAKIIDSTDLPKGAVSILPMDRETGNLLVTDERFKLLSFTGSPDVGWVMKSQCGKKKVVLELGGNAATIITESADFKDALQKSLMGAFA
jgi:acyl-CoA reductase-like NAD-dependent aldehyde dehydrogenase